MRWLHALFSLVLVSVGASACEKGCVSTAFEEHGAARANSSAQGGIPLRMNDCPDGLLRCVGRAVQASRLYAYPFDCVPSEKKGQSCSCPWDDVLPCAAGCVAENLELVLPPERASQLCAPENPAAVFGPPPALAVGAAPRPCRGESFRCEGGVVYSCARPGAEGPVPIAACLKGCAEAVGEIDDEDIEERASASLLCAR